MHRILDIDLDFFLSGICPLAEKGERPQLYGHEPWQEENVRTFLEQNCGLMRSRPVKARIFETHDGALSFWHELIKSGEITAPFSVTHIDAHSDLGIGKPGPGFVLSTVISTRLDKRIDIERYYAMNELDEANYLLFAVGFRWLYELINVRNPHSVRDIPREILFGESNKRFIRLSSFASGLLEGINGKEPAVSYREYEDYNDFHAEGDYDFASLAISPRYAPKEADKLVDVVSEYFILI